tara:strand:- start:1003 stop:1428 length:426 start_codon:yes stop_codon:yes gene_type:complete
MFREYLKKDLLGIFEKERVNFTSALSNLGSELGAIFVLIEQDGVKNSFRTGENYFSVTGSIEFLVDKTQTVFGFFSQRMALSRYETAGKFILLDRESNESINFGVGRILIKKSQRFSYRVAIPYNKAPGNITELELELNIN